MTRVLWGIAASLTLVHAPAAGDWPAFRGPKGNGFSEETNVPVEWSADKHVKWQVKLPGPGNGSPVVVGDKVFVSASSGS